MEKMIWSAVPVPWAAEHFSAFLPAYDFDAAQVDGLAAAVVAGNVECMEIRRGADLAAFVAVRMDGLEFEIVAAAGNLAGHSITREILPVLEDMAFERGARAIRINTFRRGLMAELSRQGYGALHVAFWKAI